jgi:hypothetical protein
MNWLKRWWGGFLAASILWLGVVALLGTRPDYNPFYAIQVFRNLRVVTGLKWLDARVQEFHTAHSRYPADREELLRFANDPAQSRSSGGVPFGYRAGDRGYVLWWSRTYPDVSRSSVLIHNGITYLSLEDIARRGLLLDPGVQSGR